MAYYEAWDKSDVLLAVTDKLREALAYLEQTAVSTDSTILYKIEEGDVVGVWTGQPLAELIAEKQEVWATAFDHEKQ